MDKKYRLMAVTNTHWDREWYMDYQKTRIKLVHLIDKLLDLLDTDPEFVSFMMDGQTLLLEDYLEIKPENFERLKVAINMGRIVIGPWYILPDEVLVSGETHIRNYLFGTHVAKMFNAKKMEIGYLPDSFGHPSQMPQILRKLGMNSIVFWRGATSEIDKNEFIWHSKDGTSVLAVLMPQGYSTGCELTNNPSLVAERFDEYIENMAPRSMTELIYLSNGGDHLEPSSYISRLLKETSRFMRNGTVTHTTLDKFVSELASKLDESTMTNIFGELRGSNTAILLGSTLSTRMYLKQLNHKATGLLEYYLEPIYSIISAYGGEYPQNIINRAWKYLLENQPHDSICGCSIDSVHIDMLFRFNQVYHIADALLDDASTFFQGIDRSSVMGAYHIAVFNSFGSLRSDVLEVLIDVDSRTTASSDYSGYDENGFFPIRHIDNSENALQPQPKSVRMYDGSREIPAFLAEVSVENKLKLGYDHFPHQCNVNRLRIIFLAENVPSMGIKLYGIMPIYTDEHKEELKHHSIMNEYFIVELDDKGTLRITDIENKKVLKRMNRLVDGGDCGDEYTYCPPDDDFFVEPDMSTLIGKVTDTNKVYQRLELSGVLKLPKDVENRFERRSKETVDCNFVSIITLYTGVRRIDIKTTITNLAKNHRLRVHFPTGCFSKKSFSAGIFSVDERLITPEQDIDAKELCLTHPQKDFCDISDAIYGVTIANRGLHEYEAINDGTETTLAITLLRCTGVISQRKMRTRMFKGGWSEKANDAQCIGTWDFEYSIIPHKGTWDESQSFAEAHSYNYPMKGFQISESEETRTSHFKPLVQVSSKLMIVTALKKCEFENAYILRMYNSTPNEVDFNVHFGDAVKRVNYANLREDTLCDAGLKKSIVSIKSKPYEIITLKYYL